MRTSLSGFAGRILPVDAAIADRWARLSANWKCSVRPRAVVNPWAQGVSVEFIFPFAPAPKRPGEKRKARSAFGALSDPPPAATKRPAAVCSRSQARSLILIFPELS